MTNHQDETPGESIQRTLNWLLWACLGVFVYMVIVPIGGFWYVSQQADANREVLCTFRLELERRVQASEQFLIEHPDGFAGISPEVIEQNLANQRESVNSLSDLECPPALPLPETPSEPSVGLGG